MTTTFFQAMVEASTKRILEERSNRDAVAAVIMAAFARVRQKAAPDSVQKISELQANVNKMLEGASVTFQYGQPVVKASGASEDVLKRFRRGSEWFDPVKEIDNIIVAAVLACHQRS